MAEVQAHNRSKEELALAKEEASRRARQARHRLHRAERFSANAQERCSMSEGIPRSSGRLCFQGACGSCVELGDQRARAKFAKWAASAARTPASAGTTAFLRERTQSIQFAR